MPPKKNKVNGFFLYMQDYIASEKRIGRNISMAIAQSECDSQWKALTVEEKNVYTQRGKSLPQVSTEKYTSNGKPLSIIQSGLHQKIIAEKQLISDVKSLIKSLIRGSTLEEQYFYIIHVNTFCVTTNHEYIPAEIAILEFNLYDGEKEVYHAIINPGPIPSGYAFEARSRSKDSHIIPLPPYEPRSLRLAEPKDAATVFAELKRFLDKRLNANGRYPILFAHRKIVTPVKGVLTRLAHNSYCDELPIRVAEADRLLYELKNKSVEEGPDPDAGFPVLNNAQGELERDVNCYKTGLACKYHEWNDENQDRYHHCSRSHVKRIFYSITDHCCHHLGIEMQPGSHCTSDSVAATPSATGLNTPRSDYAASSLYELDASNYQGSGNDDSDDGFIPVDRKKGVGRGRGFKN